MISERNNNVRSLEFYIDRGGTFTDCIGIDSTTQKEYVIKLLSVDPKNYKDAPTEAIRRILEIVHGSSIPRDSKLSTDSIRSIRMGTTVATNALLERQGERTALLVTRGFKDALKIGNQARPHIFDLSIQQVDVLYETVVEVDERVTLASYTASSAGSQVDFHHENDSNYVKGISGEWIHVLKRPDLNELEPKILELYQQGIRSLAICFLHSFTYPEHEWMVHSLCKRIGFDDITVSSDIMPMIKFIPRGNSAVTNAYLTPCLLRYISSFYSGFDDDIKNIKIEFMQSDGGLTPVSSFTGFKSILSGPGNFFNHEKIQFKTKAAGVVGYAKTSWKLGYGAVIGFDMGGTSTDVSRYDGQYEHVFETKTAGVTIQAPQLDIQTVAAGGGSRLFFRNGMFVVGPESVGANPGPCCYRKGGPLAITDANLVLGRLIPDEFPKIFGPHENEALDVNTTRMLFNKLTNEMNASMNFRGDRQMTVDQVAYGFIQVANESMCRPIRALTQSKGYDTRHHILSCFGGAGAQHACAIAKGLGIKTILIHRHGSILSAYGLLLANVIHELLEPSACIFNQQSMEHIRARVDALKRECLNVLLSQGFTTDIIELQVFLNLRYHGTDTAIMILKPKDSWEILPQFLMKYQSEFGFTLSNRDLMLDDIRIRGIAKSQHHQPELKVFNEIETVKRNVLDVTRAKRMENIYWETKRILTPVYNLKDLSIGDEVNGPALLTDSHTTIALEPECIALVTSEHVVIKVSTKEKTIQSTELDPIQLSIFGHRFMSIAEQMGFTLQKTSISTNIKERLDFSCAIFGPDGGLVANAPHIPVHLGSMQEAVKWQMQHIGHELKQGDVLLTNHPAAGGSHLPDMTVITPVFEDGDIIFFVASRGHHADIGGIEPGSMPPQSKELYQEGAAIKSFKLVENGIFKEEEITEILFVEPATYPGCTGTRCLSDVLSDLKAQVAANQRGIALIKNLIVDYELNVVQAYMKYIQQNAEAAVRNLLLSFCKDGKDQILFAKDFMDDGTPICLTIKIDALDGSAEFDFKGTGPQVYGNWNAPKSVTYSAIIYCLRCLVQMDIPLNQGALEPIHVKIPENCLLNPSEYAAVVGGNVMTSQRLCDVILKAFDACSASQGCCNNFTFGMSEKIENEKIIPGFGYYETIGGGSGAGPTWDGASGVHTHMTNTRLTDVELFERRYPVILHEFGLRHHSGGKGIHKGGDGMIRVMEFLEKLHVSILSERRVFPPFGLHGGEPGLQGVNTLMRKEVNGYREINLGGKNTFICNPGDYVRIETPGGGGWGAVNLSTC